MDLLVLLHSFLESKFKIGPCTDRLYAVLPAGVETRTPSHIKFFHNIFFFLLGLLDDAACFAALT